MEARVGLPVTVMTSLSPIDTLLAGCCARIGCRVTGRTHGAGFWIAPTIVVTSAHVVDRCQEPYAYLALDESVSTPISLIDRYISPDRPWPDLPSYPDVVVASGNPVDVLPAALGFSWHSTGYKIAGFPSQAGSIGLAVSEAIGDGFLRTGSHTLLKLRSSNIPKGMSGGPVFSTDGGLVVGVLIATRSNSHPSGALVTPFDVLDDSFSMHAASSRAYHLQDGRWRAITNGGRRLREGPGIPQFYGVPARTPFFVGREYDLRLLQDSLQEAGNQVVAPLATTGLGGIGKTELAAEYCYRYRANYKFIWWISAASRQSLVDGLILLAEAAGVAHREMDPDLAISRLYDYLDAWEDPWLLVFDNADEPAYTNGLIPTSLAGQVLITSRISGWEARGVNCFPLESLSQDESLRLLELTSGSAEKTDEAMSLSDDLGGLPLAIRQAGAFLRGTGWTFAQYADLLRSSTINVLSDNVADLRRPAGEQLTVSSVWQSSLGAAESEAAMSPKVLSVLSCFEAEDIPSILIQRALLNESDFAVGRALAALVKFSLVRNDSGSFSLHRLIQQATLAALEVTMGSPAINESLQACLSALLATIPADPDDNSTWPVFGRLLGHSMRIIGLSTARQHVLEDIATLGASVGLYLNARGRRADALSLLNQIASQCNQNSSLIEIARIYSARARVKRNLGNLAEASEDATYAVEVLGSGTDSWSVHTHTALGRIVSDQGDVLASIRHFELALIAVRAGELKGSRVEVMALNHIGRAHLRGGDASNARDALKKALQLDQALHSGRHADTAWTLDNLGMVEFFIGNLEGARRLLTRALDIESVIHGPDHPRTAWSLRNLASVLMATNQAREAAAHLTRSLEIIQASTPMNSVELTATRNKLKEALALMETSGSGGTS